MYSQKLPILMFYLKIYLSKFWVEVQLNYVDHVQLNYTDCVIALLMQIDFLNYSEFPEFRTPCILENDDEKLWQNCRVCEQRDFWRGCIKRIYLRSLLYSLK